MRTDNTRCERAAKMTEKRLREGWKRYTIWLPPESPVDKAKELFKGQQGGIKWPELVSAAIAHAEQHREQQP